MKVRTPEYQPIADLLARVRSRWRWLEGLRALVRAALAAAAVLAVSLLLGRAIDRAPIALAIVGSVGLLALIVVGVWVLRPLRHVPSDRRVARFIEERLPELDERLVSAVGATESPDAAASGLLTSMMADASRAASAIDPLVIVRTDSIRKAAIQAGAAVVLCAGVAFWGRHTVRQAADAVSLALFPSRLILEVTPGDARVQAGSALTVKARLVGNQAPVVAQLLRDEGAGGANDREWRAFEMSSTDSGFMLALTELTRPFRYKVVAGPATSRTFSVTVVRPPRVTRIDVQYTYPKGLGLPDRVEEDGGDVYAPEGTSVRLLVHTDLPAASGRMLLPDNGSIALTGSGQLLKGAFELREDTSYRLTLADAEGLTSRGDTEYFVRVLEDRPPEVRVVRPASDRRVTPLEEVDIEADAEDDFGIASLDLVYAIRGGAERIVPLRLSPRGTAAAGRHTLYLEDLDVRPGDFVSYYVRARDLARGKRSSEARSDIFFLEVKPFEEEFTLAQTQAAMGGGQSNQQLDDLVAAQKQIIVATWKLDRRAQASRGAKSEEDIRSVARAEGELKARVEQAASSLRQLTMRDPRRPGAGRGLQPGSVPRAGQTLAEEDAMSTAASAMGAAVAALDALKTTDAIPPEMEALNYLLKAQADVKKRQIQQQAGGGPGSNRTTQDLSSLFDKELARQQQTNYETPKSAQEDQEGTSELDKIRDLARRQDELLGRQRELARDRDRMSSEEIKRALESLTREQNALRQRAEEVARQMEREQGGRQQGGQSQNGSQDSQQSGQPQGAQQSQSGQQGQARQSQQGQPGRGQSAQGQQGDRSTGQSAPGGEPADAQERDLREISEEMRAAAGELRRQDAGQASARASRALEKLRELERELQARTPDGRRRALGDLQLEARQLADAERQIASEARRVDGSDSGKDTLRRLAGEQQRLAERLRSVQEGLTQQGATGLRGTKGADNPTGAGRSGGPGAPGNSDADAKRLQKAAREVARELERQRLGEQMQQSADALRARAQPGASDATPSVRDRTASAQEEIAQALDRVAERLAAADRPENSDSRKLADQLSRAQELRDRLDDLTRQLGDLDRQGAPSQSGRPGAKPDDRADSTARGATGDGRARQGQADLAGTSQGVDRLRADVQRELERVRDLIRETDRDQGRQARGGAGITFEGQGMTLSAPGTEAFKQDFARWQELKRQAAAALEQVESSLAKKLQEQDTKDRLASGADDRAPARYQEQVESYFKALATRKKPQ